MNVTMVERNCVNCLLRVLSAAQAREPIEENRALDPEEASELQVEQIVRSLGPDWKW